MVETRKTVFKYEKGMGKKNTKRAQELDIQISSYEFTQPHFCQLQKLHNYPKVLYVLWSRD